MEQTILTQVAGILLLVALAAHLLRRVVGFVLRYAPRDPQRRFDNMQRQLLMAYAHNQCEHRWMLIVRCPQRTRLQADHIIPWSRGGRTLIENGQMLCARHNHRKTNRLPSLAYLWSIKRRRARGRAQTSNASTTPPITMR